MLSPEVLAHRSLARVLGAAGRPALDHAASGATTARHCALTLRALEHVIQPEDAPRVLGSPIWVRRAAGLGPFAGAPLWLCPAIHALVASLVTADLDSAAEWRKGPCLRFVDFPLDEQAALVSERLAHSPIATLYLLLQTACAAATLSAAA